MTFQGDVERFAAKAMRRTRDVHNGVADLAFASIVEGSAVTSAPGQPVQTGNLKSSWQNVVEGPLTRVIMTNVIYAPFIEEGVSGPRESMGGSGQMEFSARPGFGGKPLVLRSAVGGFHSVKLTRAAWPQIVAHVTREVAGRA